MGVAFKIVYHELVVKEDIPWLGAPNKARVKKAIEGKLSSAPEVFGKPLRRSLKGYRKLRVGDFRVIFRIEGQTVKVLIIGHRSIVYKMASNRPHIL